MVGASDNKAQLRENPFILKLSRALDSARTPMIGFQLAPCVVLPRCAWGAVAMMPVHRYLAQRNFAAFPNKFTALLKKATKPQKRKPMQGVVLEYVRAVCVTRGGAR